MIYLRQTTKNQKHMDILSGFDYKKVPLNLWTNIYVSFNSSIENPSIMYVMVHLPYNVKGFIEICDTKIQPETIDEAIELLAYLENLPFVPTGYTDTMNRVLSLI